MYNLSPVLHDLVQGAKTNLKLRVENFPTFSSYSFIDKKVTQTLEVLGNGSDTAMYNADRTRFLQTYRAYNLKQHILRVDQDNQILEIANY